MRNALILTGVWLGILMTAYAIVFWDQGIDRPLPISILDQQVQAAKSEYVHPDGLFSLSIPMGWQVEKDIAYVEMMDPNASVTVWVVASDAVELATALDEAFALAHLGTSFVSTSGAEGADPWTGEDVRIEYRSEVVAEVVAARAVKPERITVVMFATGPQRALDALSENLDWIWGSLTIPADELRIL